MRDFYVFQHALGEFMRLKRLAIWLVICGVAYLMAKAFVAVSANDISAQDAYGALSSILVFRLLPLVSAIFTTAVISGEVEQKTIVYLLTRPIDRWKLILYRASASMVVVVMISLIAAITVSFAVFGSGALSNPVLYRDLVALGFGALAYGGLFLLFSLLFNRAMLICLLFAFGWETTVPLIPGDIHRLSIFSYLNAIADHPQLQGDVNPITLLAGQTNANVISRSDGVAVIILLIGITLALSAWWFTRFEYVPREDAE